VHQFGDVSTGQSSSDPSISTNATGFGVGTHFNPAGVAHGCFPNSTRHAGDIGNLVVAGPESASQFFSFTRDLLSLGSGSPSLYSIIGRGIVLHAGEDHCSTFQPTGSSGAAIAQGVIGIVDPQPIGLGVTNDAYQALAVNPLSAIGIFKSTTASATNIAGFVQFGWNAATSRMRVAAQVTGLAPNTYHGFHVHEFGNDLSADGSAAGGHYNPAGVTHALPPTAVRHMGDMGNLYSDANGVATYDQELDLLRLIPDAANLANIIGRSVLIHQLNDDGLGSSGNAGSRYAVAVIGISNRFMPPPQNAQVAQASIRGDSLHPSVSGVMTFDLAPGATLVRVNITLTGLAAGTYATHGESLRE
jgi:Cu-Zn family superoxide dismutase